MQYIYIFFFRHKVHPPGGGQPPTVGAGAGSSAWGQRPVGVARGSSIMKAAMPTSNPQQRPPAPAALGRATTHRDVSVAEAPAGGMLMCAYFDRFLPNYSICV